MPFTMVHRRSAAVVASLEVLRKLSDELVIPSCPRVAEVVQVRHAFGWNALRAGISRSAASAFPNTTK
jgi:hypothetical protein